MARMPRRTRLLLLITLTAFASASVGHSQDQPSGYRLGHGQRLEVSQPEGEPKRATISLSDDPPDAPYQAEEQPHADEQPQAAAEPYPTPEPHLEPEAEIADNSQAQPQPRPHYQPQYQPPYSPRAIMASIDEPLPENAALATGEKAPLPLAARSEKSGRQLARPATISDLGPIGTVVGSLAIVLGLFVTVVWISRRLGPSGSAPLPKEAVELLGRTTVSGQHTLQLVRFGGRLLLVALAPHGAAVLTEIIDPTEVERLTAICLRQRPGSSSESFRQTIRQLEREPAGRSFVDQRRPASAATASRARPISRA